MRTVQPTATPVQPAADAGYGAWSAMRYRTGFRKCSDVASIPARR